MNSKLVSTLLYVLLIIPLALSQDGCFLYQDSPFYCTDISSEKAQQECSFYEGCALLSAFSEGETCANVDAFPSCQKVLCKSSCKEEFAGRCLGGKVPEGKESEWCSSGCCQFPYFGGSFCGYLETKWRCEAEAKNKDVAQYIFAFPTDEFTCEQQCSQGLLSVEKVQSDKIVNVSEETILPSLPSYPVQQDPAKDVRDSLFLLWLLFFAFVAGMIYLAHALWRYSTRSKLHLPEEAEEKRTHWEWIRFGSTAVQERIKKLRSAHQHKVRHKEHRDVLQEFGSVPIKKEDAFTKLQEVARHQKPKKEKPVFENLEHLAEVIKEKENKLLQKNEAEKALEKLKEMVVKK